MAAESESCVIFRTNAHALLQAKKISIEKAAEEIGMSRPGLSRILHGHEGITLDRAERIAKFLGKTLAEMLTKKKVRVSA